MTFTEFQRRAYAVGINAQVSGTVFFFPKDGITVRVKLREGMPPQYAVAHLTKGNGIAFKHCTVDQASKALKLPRR